MSESEKTSKASRWDDRAHTALCVALDEALRAAGSSAAQQSDVIVASMQASQLTYTWEGIRWVLCFLQHCLAWDNQAQLDLFLVMLSVTGPAQLSEDQKAQIESEMQSRGYDLVWNGIRFIAVIMSKWEGPFKDDLIQAFFTICPPNTNQKQEIADYLHSKGHTITWDAIRYFSFSVSYWDAPGVYRDILTVMSIVCKPSAAALQQIVEDMNARGYQFTYHGLK
ncbi:hypothetical protein SPI_03050 [Niveomyces insectorum RCEF 264]|uniref:Uncharacterized protein n=1 Tax=Niveomyces insectorum RCEF 264 TaxID=1081102 RepID=A0A167X110_9HYPO|nr:hypothetical protein SPI_03050 [Niveomyces insectorum RCEF 264]